MNVLAQPSSEDRHMRRMLFAVLVASVLLLCGLAMGFAPSSASASSSGYFCPPSSGGTISLNASPDRCIHVYHTNNFIVDFTNFATDVSKCSIVKPNADGSGGNVFGQASCQPGRNIATVAFPAPGVPGYATGSNDSGNFHTGFKGFLTLW